MKIQPLPGFQGLVVVRGDWVRQNLVAPLYFGNRAPRRIRSQANAQKHQGPRNLGGTMRASALPREGLVPTAVS